MSGEPVKATPPEQSYGDIGVLVVSYRNNPELISFLRHLDQTGTSELGPVVAVANGLDAAAQEELHGAVAGLLPGRLTLFASSDNPGYFGGARVGYDALVQLSPTMPRWTIVTNDDVRFEVGFFSGLSALDCREERNGVVAPDTLVPATQVHQNPFYRKKPAKLRLMLLSLLAASRGIFFCYAQVRAWTRRMAAQQAAPAPALVAERIYAPHGACILLSSEYFRRGGHLRFPGFLYGEEFFVAESAKALGLQVRFEPSLRVQHFEHATTGRAPSRAMHEAYRNSLRQILREFY